MMEKWWHKKSLLLIVLLFLYFIPALIQIEFDDDFHIKRAYLGLPGVLSGDEPHYLIVTTSLINDFDVYVENNYDNAFVLGGCDAGYHFRNQSEIRRHILMYSADKKILVPINEKNSFNETTYLLELEEISIKYNVTDFKQVNQRPLGLPIVSMIFLWPLKNTCMIEAGAILITLIISLMGIFFFYSICYFYCKKYKTIYDLDDEQVLQYAIIFTGIFALCTPFWHYSKTYFVEPYLAVLLMGAYYFFIVRKQNILPGLFLGVGFAMKPPFGIYGLLFGCLLLYKREWRRILLFGLGSLLPLLLILYTNWFYTGSLLSFPRAEYLSYFDNYLGGIVASLFHPTFGLITFAPFFIFSGLGLWEFYKHDKESLIHFILMIVPYFLFWSFLALTEVGGGGGYAGRYNVPLLGFFVLLSMVWYLHNKNSLLRKLFIGAVIFSFVINAQAAFFYFLFWEKPIWFFLSELLSNTDRIKEVSMNTIRTLWLKE